MTIENSLERIAVALETIVKAATPQQPANETPAPAPAPAKGRKKVASEKAPEPPAPEPTPEETAEEPATDGGFDDEPASDPVVEDVPSKEDMIAALTELGSLIGTDEARKLMAKYGGNAKKASEVPDSKRAEVIKQAKDAKAKAEKAKK